MADAGVGPARDATVADEKRFERADPWHRLDHAVLAQQRSDRSAVDAEDGPVRLLSDIGARIRAAARLAGDMREECVGIRGLDELDRGRLRAAEHADPARLRIGKVVVLDIAASTLDAAHGPP